MYIIHRVGVLSRTIGCCEELTRLDRTRQSVVGCRSWLLGAGQWPSLSDSDIHVQEFWLAEMVVIVINSLSKTLRIGVLLLLL